MGMLDERKAVFSGHVNIDRVSSCWQAKLLRLFGRGLDDFGSGVFKNLDDVGALSMQLVDEFFGLSRVLGLHFKAQPRN
jgi:hypothetical protein